MNTATMNIDRYAENLARQGGGDKQWFINRIDNISKEYNLAEMSIDELKAEYQRVWLLLDNASQCFARLQESSFTNSYFYEPLTGGLVCVALLLDLLDNESKDPERRKIEDTKYTVWAYHGPHVGMELEGRGSREEAWEICRRFGAGRDSWPSDSYVEVHVGGRCVWSKGSIESVDHSQWLSRCRY